MKNIYTLAMLYFGLQLALYAQTDSLLTVQGVVYDHETAEALPYVHVSLEGEAIGTVSNWEGEFSFKIMANQSEKTLLVSSLGYKVFSLPLKNWDGKNLSIKLIPAPLILEEVEVKPVSAKELLSQAIAKFPENHVTKATLQTGFYRESVQELDTFRRFSEAVLKIYKAPDLKSNDRVKIEKARKLGFEDSTRNVPNVSGGPHVGVFLDVTKSKRSFMTEKYFKLYNYQIKDLKTYGEYQVYVIQFTPKAPHKKALYEGEIYLEIESLALVGVDFIYSPHGITVQNQAFSKRKRNLIAWTRKHYSVRYREFEEKWHIELATFDGELTYLPNATEPRQLVVAADFLTTDIETKNVTSFLKNEIVKDNAVFRNHLGEYDESFWKSYNTIKATSAMQKVLE